jgi:hypothetical protein
VVRQRVLTKGKLRAVWSDAGAMGYPHEGVFKLLSLTEERNDQVDGQWSEIDFDEAEWRLTPERIKCGRRPAGPAGLRSSAQATRWTKGDFAFSTSEEVKPVEGTEDRPNCYATV